MLTPPHAYPHLPKMVEGVGKEWERSLRYAVEGGRLSPHAARLMGWAPSSAWRTGQRSIEAHLHVASILVKIVPEEIA